jgi:RES domain-containing protein
MTVHLWRIATDTPDYTADELSGKGAELTGGRWNRKGKAVVYAAAHVSLAVLETIAHRNAGPLPLNRYLVRIDVPDDIWKKARRITVETADVGWDAIPAGKVSLDYGDRWLDNPAKPALLRVPSAIVPEEENVLIDPRHVDSRKITATKLRKWTYDGRVWT